MTTAIQPKRPRKRKAASGNGGRTAQRIAGLIATIAGLSMLYGIYCLATRNLHSQFEEAAPITTTKSTQSITAQDRTFQMAKRYLPHRPWAASPFGFKMQTVDGKGFYYFQHWTKESAKVLRLEPFAVISNKKDAGPEDPPYTIVSDAAYVTFARDFNMLGENPGPIIRAGLEGNVQIEGPHNLVIRGQNFNFEREAKRIYCDKSEKKVTFKFDGHHGMADGMQLELIMPDALDPNETLTINGVSSVKLLQNVEMSLVGDPSEQIQVAQAKSGPKRQQTVEIRSDGSFNYLFETHKATFERNVRISRETSPKKFDQLFADRDVEIVFDRAPPKPRGASAPATAAAPQTVTAAKPSAPPSKGPLPAPGTEAQAPGFDPNLTFKSLHARGKVVKLISQANGLRATMRDFTYDRKTREAWLSSAVAKGDPDERNERSRNSSGVKNVTVVHNGDYLRAPLIHLIHDERGEDLALLECLGPGDLSHSNDKTRQVDLTATWLTAMRKHPDLQSALDVIDLDDNAFIEQPLQSAGMVANHIHLWLARPKKDGPAVRSNSPAGRQGAPAGLQLDHVLATQKVAVLSPQLEAETERLEMWFEPGPSTPAKEVGDRGESRSRLLTTSKTIPGAADGTLAGPSASAGKNGAQADAKGSTKSKDKGGKPAEPYRVRAPEINVRLIQGPNAEQPRVAGVICKGNGDGEAVLAQAHPGEKPLLIKGNKINVQNRSDTDQEMVVLGQPAHIHERGAHIEGSRIRIDRQKNTADVDGAGRLQLPTRQTAAAGQGADVPLDVDWQRQMHFDGKTADFFGGVHTSLNDGQTTADVHCRKMSAVLNKHFSFTQERPKNEQVEVQHIYCYGGVEFESDAIVNGRKAELRRGTFRQLQFDRVTGETHGDGPGLLRIWRHTENGRSPFLQVANSRSNSPPQTRKATQWEFWEVRFTESMDGDFSHLRPPHGAPESKPQTALASRTGVQPVAARRSVFGTSDAWASIFRGNVECLYGPVERPMETISRNDLSEDSGWLGCESLELTQNPQTKSADARLTMLARENAQIEGKAFRGVADVVSYDGATGYYTLSGEDGRIARLWRQLRPGADQSQAQSNKIRFNPVQQSLFLDQSPFLGGSQ